MTDDKSASLLHDWIAVSSRLGGVSRSTVFNLWKTGQLASVKVGARRFSTDRQIAEFIARLEDGGQG